jgi:hypothetical protein
MDKPRIFIGSSTEGLALAEALYACLSYETVPKLWTHQLFLPGKYPLEVLEEQIRMNDFAVLVASPDDQILKRGESSAAMRDNMLLEFGLFAGALGRRRAFFVCPTTPKVELPSDLFGVMVAEYDATRGKGRRDEVAAAMQIPCQQIRAVVAEQWDSVRDERERISAGIRASEQGRAVERLYGVVTKLRDAVIVVQRDATAAVNDEPAFDRVKRTAVEKVTEIAEALSDDAELIGVARELDQLRQATCGAVEDLPFPRELSLGREAARQKVVNTGLGALDSLLSGGDPIRHVEEAASREATGRIRSLQARYMEWWDRHFPEIDDATSKLQRKLFDAAMDLASRAFG